MNYIQNPEPQTLDTLLSNLETAVDPLYVKFPRRDGQWLVLLAAPSDAPNTDDIFHQFVGQSKPAGLTLVVADTVREATTLSRRAHRVRVARGGRVVHDEVLSAPAFGAALREWWVGKPAFA